MKKKNRKQYAIYNAKDELVFVGDYEECSRYMEVSKKGFRAVRYRTNKPRKWYIVEIEKEEDKK